MKFLLTILFSFFILELSAQFVPGTLRQQTIAGNVMLVWTPSDTTVPQALRIYHGGNGVIDSTSLVSEGDSTLPKYLARGWWNGQQVIPGGYSSPQSGGVRSTVKYWVLMFAQQQ